MFVLLCVDRTLRNIRNIVCTEKSVFSIFHGIFDNFQISSFFLVFWIIVLGTFIQYLNMLASKNVNVKNMQFDVIKKLYNFLLAKFGAKMSFFSWGKKSIQKYYF